ncbi:Maf-like protein C3G6.03c [Wickerhamiella sorbophila]|uniref:Maf-like protein C3G6.03c n=1 Tax=Wickerhamiella sorbophila TaxID=45607 RepID=A0A2T0FEL0_9ASCO|nr:Maf-like protein C3G6.03c [Wickerhamiella sorbophila]PRT53436.1 Maf-like protein C3G6.03c [Wickerhamiella sorbophila]
MDTRLLKRLNGQRVVLASKSPRRLDIVKEQIGLDSVEVIGSGFPEDLDKDQYAPFEYVVQTAIRKAIDVYQSEVDADEPPALVLAADTVVVNQGLILEKPVNVEHQIAMLKQLRDAPHPHRVFTGVVAIVPLEKPIAPGYAMESYLGDSKVKFRSDISDEEIEAYAKSGEALDAAGGYKIQGGAKKFVENVEGDVFNVIGLPVGGTIKLIENTFRVAEDSDSESD